MPRIIDCAVEFGHITDYSLIYQCKPGCDAQTVFWSGGNYSAFSNICASAIHGGFHDRSGGLVSIRPSTASEQYTPILSNNILSKTGGAAPSFTLRKVADNNEISCDDLSTIEPKNVTASSFLKYFRENSGVESVSTYLNWNPNQAISTSLSPWAPDMADDDPWLEIDFGKVYTIKSLKTYSSQIPYFDFRTENFTMAIENENSWEMVLENNQVRTFESSGQPSRHHFPNGLQTRKVRIFPISAENSPVPAMKLEIFGCETITATDGQGKFFYNL